MAEIHQASTKTKPVGRILRFLLGAVLVARVISKSRGEDWDFYVTIAVIVIGLLVLYILTHFVVSKYFPKINRWFGAILALVPVFAVYIVGGDVGQAAALSYLGLSLLLASVRADSGCEVMSIPGIVFKSRTHLVCIVFSPIDWLEEKISKRT